MDPAVILISDDEDDGDYKRNMIKEADVVLISSDEDEDCVGNLDHQDDVVLISEDENADQLGETDIKKADKAVGLGNCDEKVDRLHKGSKDLSKLSLAECKLYLRKYGMKLSGTKEECIQRIIKHVRLIGGDGASLYPRSSFSIDCTGNACKGDVVMFKQNIHDSKGEVVTRTIVGRIVGVCGRDSKQQLYSIEVLWSEPVKSLYPLSILVLKRHKLYKFGTFRQPWTNESERSEVLTEKHVLRKAAKQKRKRREIDSFSINNKGKKRRKVSHRGPFQSKQPTQTDKLNPKRKGADTSTPERKAVTVRFKKTRLKRLKDGSVDSPYPKSSFSINCTGDACKGDIVLFKLKQSITRRNEVGKLLTLAGKIVKESYGALRQHHTFTVELLWPKDSINPSTVTTMLVRGYNLYKYGTFRQPWKNEEERLEVLEEKHKRGKAARHQKRLRIARFSSIVEKGGKPEKSSRNKQTRIVKVKLSKRWGAKIANPCKRKAARMAPDPNSNPSQDKQPTRKQKFSKRPGLTLVEDSKAAHKRQAERFNRMESDRSTQLTFNQDPITNPNPTPTPAPTPNPNPNPNPTPTPNPNPNRSICSDHNIQEAPLSFHYDHPNPNRIQNPNTNPNPNRNRNPNPNPKPNPNGNRNPNPNPNPNLNRNPNRNPNPNRNRNRNLNPNPNPNRNRNPNPNPKHPNPNPNRNRSMYSDHNLQEAPLSFHYDLRPNPNPNPNPNRSMYSDHNLQEAPSSFHYDQNPNPNPNPNRSMYSSHNLQEAPSSFCYDPNSNHSMYSHHHLQDPSLFLPHDATYNLWSSGYGQFNHEQRGPNNVVYQPPGEYHYNHGQPGYHHHGFEHPVPRNWFGQPF